MNASSTRGPRGLLILTTTVVLVLLATGVGTAVALATRPANPDQAVIVPAPGPAPSSTPKATVSKPRDGATSGTATPATTPKTTPAVQPWTGPAVLGTVERPLVLPDGGYPAFIRKIDVGHRAVVADFVQVLHGKEAETAAIAHGVPADQARYLDYYVVNDNNRLRVLAISPQASIGLIGCEDGRPQTLAELAKTPSYNRPGREATYFTLTVTNRAVSGFQETSVMPAC